MSEKVEHSEEDDRRELAEMLAEWRAFKRRLSRNTLAIPRAKESDNG